MPDDPYIAGAFAQLSWHISTDGILYCREMQTGVTYKMIRMAGPGIDPPVPRIPEAPTDGQLYARQAAAWTIIPPIPTAAAWAPIPPIPTVGLAITTIQPVSALEGSSVPITVNGTGFTPNSVVTWGGYPLTTTFVDDTSLEATLTLGPGSSGVYTVVVTDGAALSNSVAFTVEAAARIFSAAGVSCTLDINSDGDMIVTQSIGPNAGKKVNLTYAKWT